jgi:hypothetical protein
MAAKKIAGRGKDKKITIAGSDNSRLRKKTVIATLDSPVPTGMLAYVKGNQVVMVPRKGRGKSKRVGCHLRSKEKPNKAGGSRKMTKAEVVASFERQGLMRSDPHDAYNPKRMDDVSIRTAWNDYTDMLYKDGLITAAVYNSSVPAKFLKRKSNRTGGTRKTKPAKRNATRGKRSANRSGQWKTKQASYSDPSAAHERAMRVKVEENGSNVLITKKGDKFVVSWLQRVA